MQMNAVGPLNATDDECNIDDEASWLLLESVATE